MHIYKCHHCPRQPKRKRERNTNTRKHYLTRISKKILRKTQSKLEMFQSNNLSDVADVVVSVCITSLDILGRATATASEEEAMEVKIETRGKARQN
mmetsp:Transcript_12244/g.13951  ORF Transcript_12244/g.13951 Transcript_12244/m.13951 type:complete len:96 (+) Transcript_12244:149-436(+)